MATASQSPLSQLNEATADTAQLARDVPEAQLSDQIVERGDANYVEALRTFEPLVPRGGAMSMGRGINPRSDMLKPKPEPIQYLEIPLEKFRVVNHNGDSYLIEAHTMTLQFFSMEQQPPKSYYCFYKKVLIATDGRRDDHIVAMIEDSIVEAVVQAKTQFKSSKKSSSRRIKDDKS